MTWITQNWKALLIGLGVGLAIAVAAPYARAADLGGGCCSDLEDRIAELEATTARKGNRKVSVTIYGEINKAMMYYDADLGDDADVSVSDTRIIDNSASPSFVGFAGSGAIAKEWSAGYVLEVGVGGHDVGYDNGVKLGAITGDTNALHVQRSFVWLKSPVGTVSLGRQHQATDDLDLISTGNTGMAVRPLSFRPIIGPQTLEALDLFDGTRGDVLRYDSPSMAGFVIAASWTSGGPDVDFGAASPDTPGDAYDVALRYAGEFSGFAVAGGAGYRHGLIVNGLGSIPGMIFGGVIDDQNILDLDTLSAVGSVKHIASGVFLTVNWGDGDGELFPNSLGTIDLTTKGWALTGGIENKWNSIGKTTVFGEWGDESIELSADGMKAEIDATYWGLGVVQSVDATAMDVYLNVRQYNLEASDGTVREDLVDAVVGTVGARVRY